MSPSIPSIDHLRELSTVLQHEKFPIVSFDTSFVLKTLVKGLEYHDECVKFIEDLKSFQPVVIYSEALREELWCANLIREIKDVHKMPPNQPFSIRRYLRHNPKTPRNFHPRTVDINNKFDELMANFAYREAIPVTNKITAEAIKLIGKYNLLGIDAIHVSSMLHNGFEEVRHIAAFDDDIENITDLTVWTVGGKDRYVEHHYKEWGFKDKPTIGSTN